MKFTPQATLVRMARDEESYRLYYGLAHAALKDVSAECRKPVSTLASVLAICHRKVKPRYAVRLMIQYAMEDHIPDGMMTSVKSALATYLASGHINGLYTQELSRALRGDPNSFVLSGTLARAFGVSAEDAKRTPIWRNAKAYCGEVADKLGWTIAETHACIWAAETIKREPARTNLFLPISEELNAWTQKA